MKTITIIKELAYWDRQKRFVYTISDLEKIIQCKSSKTFHISLARIVKQGILIRAARGVYVYALSAHSGPYTLAHIALTLRRGDFVYESNESALSQWGRISQIPLDRITCMTTGRRGEFYTPFGVVEYSHTNSDFATIIANTVEIPNNPLLLAKEDFALRNLNSVRRNLDLVLPSDEEDEYELVA